MPADRRSAPGVALVTQRAGALKWRYAAAGIACAVHPVQPDTTWPSYRPPVVLDTIGMDAAVLTQLLATAPASPVIALVEPDDYRALRLCGLCPAVRLICADDPAVLRIWLRHLGGMSDGQTVGAVAAWLVPPPPPCPLDPLVLPIIAALLTSVCTADAAAQVGLIEATLFRLLRQARGALDLPLGARTRYRTAQLGLLLLDRLGADAPIRERAV